MSSIETPEHHGSHRDLLWSADCQAIVPKGIDAIIVPTTRRPAYLTEAAKLAQMLNCTLVTLHSKQWTSAARAAQRLPGSVDLIAIDVPERAMLRLPDWATSRLLHGTVFARRTDLSTKRNLGLLLSHLLGWSRVLFLDDDITGLVPAEVQTASGLLDTHNAAGLYVGGFPDNSVVCHAYREAGGSQQSFIGGGALTVQMERTASFFPDIYNEDWFFLLDGDKGLQSVAVTGQVTQYPYDPFRNPDRARAEELGDVLAEGIYWVLDENKTITDADQVHWTRFLAARRQFIERVRQMVEQDATLGPADKARRIEALNGSLGRLALITPQLCADYLRAWVTDWKSWQEHVHRLRASHLPGLPTPERRRQAIALLTRPGTPHLSCYVRAFSPSGAAVASRIQAHPAAP